MTSSTPQGKELAAGRHVSLEGVSAELHQPGQENDRPPLVLIPGVSGAKELFDSIHEPLSKKRQVLVIDLRDGKGRALLSPDRAVMALRKTLTDLAWDQVDVLGQSFGSVVAVRLWKNSPQTIRKLILAPPAVLPKNLGAYSAMLRWACMGLLVRVWPRSHDEELERRIRDLGGYALEPDLTGVPFQAFVKRVRKARVMSLFGRLLGLAGHSWKRELRGIHAPLLILEGNRELELVPKEMLLFFRSLPGARLAVVPGGHMPFLTHPEAFCRAVLEFLDETVEIPDRAAISTRKSSA